MVHRQRHYKFLIQLTIICPHCLGVASPHHSIHLQPPPTIRNNSFQPWPAYPYSSLPSSRPCWPALLHLFPPLLRPWQHEVVRSFIFVSLYIPLFVCLLVDVSPAAMAAHMPRVAADGRQSVGRRVRRRPSSANCSPGYMFVILFNGMKWNNDILCASQ